MALPGGGDFSTALGIVDSGIFWRSEFHPPVLPVRAEPITSDHPDAIDLQRLPCACAIRPTVDGREEVLIGDHVRAIRMEVVDGTLLAGPVRLHYDLSGVVGVEARTLTLRRLLALLRLGRLPGRLFPPEPRAHRWARAVQAHDGRRAGASYRDIAIALYGSRRVKEEWSANDRMRKEIFRLVLTAERLISDGLHSLLGDGDSHAVATLSTRDAEAFALSRSTRAGRHPKRRHSRPDPNPASPP